MACIYSNLNVFMYVEFLFQSDLNICVILISEIVWEKFRVGTGFIEPLPIYFPDYSKGDDFILKSLNLPWIYITDNC